MKFLLLGWLLGESVLIAYGNDKISDKLRHDDEQFWNRFLSDCVSLSISPQPSVEPSAQPSQQPSFRPSGQPSFSPSAQPTNAPSASPSAEPSFQPSEAPSSQPSSQPSVQPSYAPSASPSAEPSSQPSGQPSSEPSSQPSAVPSAAPSSEPSSVPTKTPSAQPSEAPSPMPTTTPSAQPSPTPSEEPSSQPSTMPSAQPTSLCILNVNATCIIASGVFAGLPCETPFIGVEPCRDRPTGATMLFNGGDCSQSDNRQFLQFTCVDYGAGPPIGEGERAYIVVTDAKGRGNIYHHDYVEVGKNYYLRPPAGMTRFDADQFIAIYSSEVTTPENLLQFVQYHSSCSSSLELKNRFGASQLVEYQNELQGNVSCFASATFDIDIAIPIEIAGDAAELATLTALTDFAGFIDLTEQVAGQVVPVGGMLTVTISYEFDLTIRRRYSMLVQITAAALPSRQLCTGTDFISFMAGTPGQPESPTPLPTRAPTISPAPTPDLDIATCSVSTRIRCVTLDGGSQQAMDPCDMVPDPSTIVCGSSLPATGLGFVYRPSSGDNSFPPDQIWITVSGDGTGVQFQGAIQAGQEFITEGDFDEMALIDMYTVTPTGEQGFLLDSLSIDTSCEDSNPVVRLTDSFGPLELTAFRNAVGFFSSIHRVNLEYIVDNTGLVPLIAETAFVQSGFFPSTEPVINALVNEELIPHQNELRVFNEVFVVDFGAKFRELVTFAFSMNVTARAQVSGLPCFDDMSYSF